MTPLRTACLFAVIASLLLLGQSCVRKPFACFSTIPVADSIKVNVPVTFSAACSLNANDFNWQFYNNQDSVEFGQTVIKTFKDTGSVQVYLLVTAGLNSSGYTKTITVKP
jgi:hypothetical protein